MFFTRDGSTSTFTLSGTGGTLDQFTILKSFNQNVFNQDPDSLLRASHINHYFDAALRIQENTIYNLGGPVYTNISPSGDVYGDSTKSSYQYIPFTLSSNTIIVTGQVPTQFGADPFHDPGFSMCHTMYFNATNPSNITGVWNYVQNSLNGCYNDLITKPQFFVAFQPTGGNTFKAIINNIPIHSTSYTAGSSSFSDNLVRMTNPFTQHSDVNYYVQQINNPFLVHSNYMEIYSTNSFNPCNGVMLLESIRTNDCEVIFPSVSVTGNGGGVWPITKSGFALRVTLEPSTIYGQPITAYVLSIGDTVENSGIKPTQARLRKLINCDIQNPNFNPSTTWSDLAGTVIDLTPANVPFLDPSYYAFKFKVLGSVIDLQYKTSSGSTWTSFTGFPVTDTSPLSGFADGSGAYNGFFSHSMNGHQTVGMSVYNSNANILTINGPVLFNNLSANPFISCGLAILYFNADPPTPIGINPVT